MWIKGIDALIQTDELNSVAVRGAFLGSDRFNLYVSFRGLEAREVLDEFGDDEKVANAAKDWFYLLLTGEIDKDEWEQGRTDADKREGILERKEAVERRRLMSPTSSLDQDAYLAAVSEAGREFIEYYMDVLAPDCEKFLELLRAFRKEQIAMGWPGVTGQKRLVQIFEEATGIEYDGELNT